jgi:hypothetical protein
MTSKILVGLARDGDGNIYAEEFDGRDVQDAAHWLATRKYAVALVDVEDLSANLPGPRPWPQKIKIDTFR